MIKHRLFLSVALHCLEHLPKNHGRKCSLFSFSNFLINNHASRSISNVTIQESVYEEKAGTHKFPIQCNVNEVVGDDVELKDLLQNVMMEIEMLQLQGEPLPSKISTAHWKELLSYPSRTQRRRNLAFRYNIEMKEKQKAKESEERRRLRQEYFTARANEVQLDDGKVTYGFRGSHIFNQISCSTITKMENLKLLKAVQFSQPLVFDCSYGQHMTVNEISNCANQLCSAFMNNRYHIEPFNLQFCNANLDEITFAKLHRKIPPLFEDWFPFNSTEKSYLDLYPKEKLVYLTPHCETDLMEYSHDDIYIVGAFVDKGPALHISSAKAKQEGIRMARLPIDKYVTWVRGNKSLNLITMINVLLEVRRTNDWNTAFKKLPSRSVGDLEGNEVKERKIAEVDLFKRMMLA